MGNSGGVDQPKDESPKDRVPTDAVHEASPKPAQLDIPADRRPLPQRPNLGHVLYTPDQRTRGSGLRDTPARPSGGKGVVIHATANSIFAPHPPACAGPGQTGRRIWPCESSICLASCGQELFRRTKLLHVLKPTTPRVAPDLSLPIMRRKATEAPIAARVVRLNLF